MFTREGVGWTENNSIVVLLSLLVAADWLLVSYVMKMQQLRHYKNYIELLFSR